MATYNKIGWKNNQPPAINQTNLNHMDEGIFEANQKADNNFTDLTEAKKNINNNKDNIDKINITLESYAKIDGEYDLLTAGVAKQIQNPLGDPVDDAEFSLRETYDGQALTDGVAIVKKITGNTRRASLNILKLEDGKYTFNSGKATLTVENSKCLIKANQVSTSDNAYVDIINTIELKSFVDKNLTLYCPDLPEGLELWIQHHDIGTKKITKNSPIINFRIHTSIGADSIFFQIISSTPIDIDATVKPMLVKGTYSLSTIPAWQPHDDRLLSVAPNGMRSTNENLWDEEIKLGVYNANTGAVISTNDYIRNKNPIRVLPNKNYAIKWQDFKGTTDFFFYDENMNYLGYKSNVITYIETPNNCAYINFCSNSKYNKNDNIIFNYGDKPLPYQPHQETKVKFFDPEQIKLSAVGNIKDEMVIDDKNNKITLTTKTSKIINAKDLSFIEEATITNVKRYRCVLTELGAGEFTKTKDNEVLPLLIDYSSDTPHYYVDTGERTTLYIFIPKETTPSEYFTQNNFEFVYELATPTTQVFDHPDLKYKAYNNGSEEWLTNPDGEEPVFKLPVPCSIQYPSDLAGKLANDYTRHEIDEKVKKINKEHKDYVDTLVGEPLTTPYTNKSSALVTGYTDGTEAIAIEDRKQLVTISTIKGRTQRASENLLYKENGTTIGDNNSSMSVKDGVFTFDVDLPSFKSMTMNGNYIPYCKEGYSIKITTPLIENSRIIVEYRLADGTSDYATLLYDNIRFNTFDLPENTTTISINFQAKNGGANGQCSIAPMLVKGKYTEETMPIFSNFNDNLVNSNNVLISTGKQLWDEQWEVGDLDNNGKPYPVTNNISTKNFNPIKENETYCFNDRSKIGQIFFYDCDKKFITKKIVEGVSRKFITPSGTRYFKFSCPNSYGTIYKNDIMLNYGTEPLPYEPYKDNRITRIGELGQWDYVDNVNNQKHIKSSKIITLKSTNNWRNDGKYFYINDIKFINRYPDSCSVMNIPTYYKESKETPDPTKELFAVASGVGNVEISGLGKTLEEFKTFIDEQNVQLLLETKDEIIEDIVPPLQDVINVWKGGLQIQDPVTPNALPYIMDQIYYTSLREQIKKNTENDTKQDASIAEVKQSIANLQLDKLDLKTYATGAGGLEQLDVNIILNAYDQYEGSFIQFYSNEETPAHLVSVGFVMTALDRVTKSLIEIDRDGVVTKWTTQTNVRMGGEIEKGLNYRPLDNHTLQMTKQQVDMMKGLRVWIEYEYGRSGQPRNILVQCQDIRFTDKSKSNFAIGVPLANPNNFSDMLVLQYKRAEAILEVSTSNTNQDLVPTSTKIVDVKGLY